MNEKYWVLVMDNFEEEDKILYFENYEIAQANFRAICEKYKDYEEFTEDEESCGWFDSHYNDCSTSVYLCEMALPKINNKILF